MGKTIRIILVVLAAGGAAALVFLRLTNEPLFKSVALRGFAWIFGSLILIALLAAAMILLASAGLIGLMVLQAVGIVKRVPLGYNFRNLIVRWRTTLLTAVGFTLVVALMTVMLAFINGIYALTAGSAVPGNIIVLADGATDEVFSDLGYGDIDKLAKQRYVKKAVVNVEGKDAEMDLVSWELYQVINQPVPNPKPGGKQRRFVQVRGVDEPDVSAVVHMLKLYDGGKWFDPGAGVQGTVPGGTESYVQGVLGEGLARELGHDRGMNSLKVGDTFELGPRQWIVVGVMNSAGKTYDSEIWAKRDLVGQMLKKTTKSTAVFRVADGLDPAQVAKDLTADFKSPAVQGKTEADYFESLNATNQTFLGAIIFVSIFIAIGCVFGIMNTMFAAISQRKRDIGVLRILGFSRTQILVSFFLEAILLALVGGLFGCALGSLANGWSATTQLTAGQGGGKSVMLKLIVDARILGLGMLFSLVMGCLGGLLPALSAIRMKVLDSLR
jgi:ABC-type lipoprotein release transport system permease subunit